MSFAIVLLHDVFGSELSVSVSFFPWMKTIDNGFHLNLPHYSNSFNIDLSEENDLIAGLFKDETNYRC